MACWLLARYSYSGYFISLVYEWEAVTKRMRLVCNIHGYRVIAFYLDKTLIRFDHIPIDVPSRVSYHWHGHDQAKETRRKPEADKYCDAEGPEQ